MTDKSWQTNGTISAIGRRVSIRVAAGLLVVGVMLFLWVRSPGTTTSTDKNPGARKRMPDLAFTDLNGKPWKLIDHHGQVVLVNFWASWCPPCRKETPGLVRLSNDYKHRGLEAVGVAMDEGGLQGVRRFVREYDVSYPILPPERAPL
jgi:thiol-disulfide isomerase/thioredoxin